MDVNQWQQRQRVGKICAFVIAKLKLRTKKKNGKISLKDKIGLTWAIECYQRLDFYRSIGLFNTTGIKKNRQLLRK